MQVGAVISVYSGVGLQGVPLAEALMGACTS